MQKILRLVAFLLVVAAPAALVAQRIVEIDVLVDKNTIPVRVSASTPELNTLALLAFGTHGRYKVVANGQAYDIRFAPAGATQVRVDITKGAAGVPFYAETITGTNLKNALLRAADRAVEKTNGLGLKGFFTARLAFIREVGRAKEVCTGDLFFTEVKQITHDNAQALMPRWAPDGSRLLYTSFYKSGFPDIFQIDLGTNQRTTFVSFKGTNQSARFSPDGSHVAMVLSGEGRPEIYVSDAQGHGVSRRTRADTVKSSPCFSADGSRLVFTMEPGPQLYVMPVGGGTPMRVTTGYSYSAEPDWSRAAPEKIAFTLRSGRNYQIGVADLGKRSAEMVSKAPFDGQEPSWLADGRHLIYTARTATESRLCILDTETGKSKPVSAATWSVMQASVWTP